MEGTIGEVRLFCGGFPPRGWMFCDGTQLLVSENTALFSVIGKLSETEQEYFSVPYLTPISENLRYIICVYGSYPSRAV